MPFHIPSFKFHISASPHTPRVNPSKIQGAASELYSPKAFSQLANEATTNADQARFLDYTIREEMADLVIPFSRDNYEAICLAVENPNTSPACLGYLESARNFLEKRGLSRKKSPDPRKILH